MPTDASLVLAIDIGTSSVRSALFGAGAQRLADSLTQRPHAVSRSPEGAAELDPATLEAGLMHCLRGTVSHARGRPVTEVGISCFWHSLIGSDSKGRALTPIYTWADARCREDAARLRAEMPEEAYHSRTGCMLRASYWPAKLRWLAGMRPRRFASVARWQSPAEWLLGGLCEGGAGICAHGMATGTGLYNPATLAWEADLAEWCGVRVEQLPALSEAPLALKPEFRRRFPMLASARWWPAIGDGAAGNLGSGATRPGRAAINVGTSAAFRVLRQGTVTKIPFGLFCYRVDTARHVIGGAVSNAGNLRDWCVRELNLTQNEAALDQALAIRPGPLSGLVVLPFWSAERAPTWREDLGGAIHGLSQNTTALDLLQATTEAVYHRLALIADLSLPLALKPADIIVSGGILKSTGLLQRLADVLGRAVRPSAEPEASLRGAAVYALERAGIDLENARAASENLRPAISPRRRIAALYARERERQRLLETLTSMASA